VCADRDMAESRRGTSRRESRPRSVLISMLIGAVVGAFCAVCQCLWVGNFSWDHLLAVAVMRAAKSGFAIGFCMVLLLHLDFNVAEAYVLASVPIVSVAIHDPHYLGLLVIIPVLAFACRIISPRARREVAVSPDGQTSPGRQT
jgi:hypothetical protein